METDDQCRGRRAGAHAQATPPRNDDDPLRDVVHAALLAEFSEANAYRQLIAGAAGLGMQACAVELCGGVALRCPDDGLGPLMNRVIGLGLREPITGQMIAALNEHYHGLPGTWCVELSPPAMTPEGVALLRTIPLRRGLATAMLAIDCGRELHWPTSLSVVRYEGRPNREAAAIQAEVFGVSPALRSVLEVAPRQPGLRQWLAYDGSNPVGACLSSVHGQSSWFGWSATLPQHRGRGVQRALLARCVEDAAAAGCRWMTAETAIGTAARPDPSFVNLRRAGFVELYRRHNHLFLPRRSHAPAT